MLLFPTSSMSCVSKHVLDFPRSGKYHNLPRVTLITSLKGLAVKSYII